MQSGVIFSIYVYLSVREHTAYTKEGSSDSKVSAYNAGDPGLICGSGRSLGQEDPLEKELATHSSILAWKIGDRGA